MGAQLQRMYGHVNIIANFSAIKNQIQQQNDEFKAYNVEIR